MPDERTPQERMVQLIENKIEDMKARATLLKMDGQALIAKGDTIYHEAMVLGNDLYKFQTANPELFPEGE
jgi:hypothetical protein